MSAPITSSTPAYNYKGSQLFFVKKTITAVQGRTLNTTPITLAPAPGSNFMIGGIHFAYAKKGATAFGTASTLQIKIDTATNPLLQLASFMTAGSAIWAKFDEASTLTGNIISNKGLLLTSSVDSATLGDAISVYVYYSIIYL